MRGSRPAAVLAAIAVAAGVHAAGGARAKDGDAVPVVEIRLPETGESEAPAAFEARVSGSTIALQGFAVRVGPGSLQTPAVEGDSVFLGAGNEMRCYQCLGGRLKWKAGTDDGGPTAPAAAGGRVVFNTQSCTVYALDAATGERKWSQWIAGSVATTPAVHDGVVFVTGPDAVGYKLEAFALADGARIFKSGLRTDVFSAPVVKDGRVVYSMADGTVAATDLSGKALWETKGEALAAPCPHEGRLLVASGKDLTGVPSLVSLDAATGAGGRAVATPPAEGGGPAKAAGDDPPGRRGGGAGGKPIPRPAPKAKPPTGPHDDPPSGSGTGKGGPPSAPPAAPGAPPRGPATAFGYEGPRPCVVGGTVALTAGKDLLLQPVGGGDVVRVPLEASAAGAPVAAGGLVLQATQEGRLVAVEASTGKVKFELRFRRLGNPVALFSSPAVSRGRAYLGTGDGTLVGVDLPDMSLDGWPMWGGSAERAR